MSISQPDSILHIRNSRYHDINTSWKVSRPAQLILVTHIFDVSQPRWLMTTTLPNGFWWLDIWWKKVGSFIGTYALIWWAEFETYQGKSFNEDKTNKPKLSKLFKGFDNSHYGLFIWFKQNKQWKSTTSFVLLKIIRFGANWKESFPSGPFWLTFDSIESVLFSSIWLFFKQKCFSMFSFL